ncbi:MAG: guanylate kinase [Lachnospiraceae bacterium]|nr:guanylate kinase [Lachnospiraceae bacterium]
MKKGILTVISGFSGVGKGTLIRELLARHPEQYALSVSVTTREPRDGEVNGVNYHFISDEEFRSMIYREQLLEYAGYVGHYYGTPKQFVEENLACGRDVILEIEVQGALKVKEIHPETLMIFIVPPSFETLKQRLIGRGTEDAATIEERLKRASEEAENLESYDYALTNDVLEESTERLHRLIQSSKEAVKYKQKELDALRAQIQNYHA